MCAWAGDVGCRGTEGKAWICEWGKSARSVHWSMWIGWFCGGVSRIMHVTLKNIRSTGGTRSRNIVEFFTLSYQNLL